MEEKPLVKQLSQQVVKGSIWVFSLRFAQQLFDFLRIIILARFLAPADFGLMGIAMVTMATLETFSYMGLQQALIQRENISNPYLDTAWTLSLFRGILVFGMLYAFAPHASLFFKTPEAVLIIRVTGIAILLQAFTNIGIVTFQKELAFDRQFIYQCTGVVASFAVSLVTVYFLRNVWAIVFGFLSGHLTRLVVSYAIHPYRPRISFNYEKAGELLTFGKWLMGSSIVIFLFSQGDDIFVGRVLGVTMLGFYQLAYRISNTPTSEIASIISQVTFPAYSKMQNRSTSLQTGYVKVYRTTLLLAIPVTGGIYVLAPEFTEIFLTDKWMPIVPIIRVLVIFGLFRAIGSTSSILFHGIGRPKVATQWETVRLFILIVFIYPFTIRFGIIGTACAVLVSQIIITAGLTWAVSVITVYPMMDQVRHALLPTLCTAAMMTIVFFLKSVPPHVSMAHFVAFVMAGIVAYGASLIILDRCFNCGIQSLMLESVASLRKR